MHANLPMVAALATAEKTTRRVALLRTHAAVAGPALPWPGGASGPPNHRAAEPKHVDRSGSGKPIGGRP